jgi:hypothetical protein
MHKLFDFNQDSKMEKSPLNRGYQFGSTVEPQSTPEKPKIIKKQYTEKKPIFK